MPFILKADLATHFYSENIDEITRADDTLVTKAISTAVAEAKSYLNKYNLDILFDPENAAYFPDENLQNKVKDLACWHLVKLANPNISLELFRTGYEDALKWFEKIMKGQIDPQGWTYREDDADTDYNEGGTITWDSNTKRSNIF